MQDKNMICHACTISYDCSARTCLKRSSYLLGLTLVELRYLGPKVIILDNEEIADLWSRFGGLLHFLILVCFQQA